MAKFIIKKLKTIEQIKREFKPESNPVNGTLFFRESGLYIFNEMMCNFGKEHKFYFVAYRECDDGKIWNIYRAKERSWVYDERWFDTSNFIEENEFKL